MSADQKKVLNWGILATGNIATHFCDDLSKVAGNRIVAVTSRDLTKAQAFAKQYQISTAYDSYADMLNDDDVDVIYIATPHVYHYEQTIAALHADKHVVCEKPIAMTPQQVQNCVALAKQKRCFLMEAVWMNFFPTVLQAQQWLAQGDIGKPLSLQANFDFLAPFDRNGRLFDLRLRGGALMDIGLYPLFFATQLLGDGKVKETTCVIGETGADIYSHVSLEHGNKVISLSKFSFLHDIPCEAVIYCERGFIKLHDRFFCGHKVSLHQYSGAVTVKEYPRHSHGYEYEINAARTAILHGDIEAERYPHTKMVANHQLLAQIREHMGIAYDH